MSGVSVKVEGNTNEHMKIKIPTERRSRPLQAWTAGKTTAVFLFHFAMGLHVSSLGLTLIHLSVMYGVQTSAFSAVFISQGVGNIAGAAVSALVFDRLPYEPQLALTAILASLATFLAPWSHSVYTFAALRGVTSFTIGYVEPPSNPYLVLLWGVESRVVAPALLAKNSMYSVGALLSPLIIRHFLVPLTATATSNSTTVDDVNQTLTSSLTNQVCSPNAAIDDSSEWSNTTIGGDGIDYVTDGIGLVRWAFAAGGVAFFAAAVVYTVALISGKKTIRCVTRPATNQNDNSESTSTSSSTADRGLISTAASCKDNEKNNQLENNMERTQDVSKVPQPEQQEQSQVLKVLMIGVLAIFLFFNVWTMLTLMQMLSTLAQCGLNWDVTRATRLVTVFYAAFVAGRVASIPLSVVLHPTAIIWANIVLQTSGLVILLGAYAGFGPIGEWGVWLGSALAGLGVSSVIGSVFVWVAKNMTISGTSSAVLMLGCYVGAFTGPTLSALVVRQAGYITIVLSTLAGCVLQGLSFAVAVTLVRRMARARLATSSAAVTSEDASKRVDIEPNRVKFTELSEEEESRPLTTTLTQ